VIRAFEESVEAKKRQICSLYERSVEADPRDATTMADYGR
jgi:hypothetical protein